jgi:hypothetical protein
MEPIQHLPAQPDRIETGSLQFGDDWPGIFIRGDDAFDYAMLLREIVETKHLSLWYQGRLGTFQQLLSSCNVSNQKPISICQECGTRLDDSDDPHFCGRCLEMHRLER